MWVDNLVRRVWVDNLVRRVWVDNLVKRVWVMLSAVISLLLVGT